LHYPARGQAPKIYATQLKVFVWGKGKARELIASNEALILVDKLIFLHKDNADIHSWKYSDKLHLFSSQYGASIGSFAKALNAAFDDAGLLYDVKGVKRNAGAFRKYYITNALLEGGVNYFELAKQCGTSVSVIEKYYAEIDVTKRPETFLFKHALSGIYDDNPSGF
jgi:integrase